MDEEKKAGHPAAGGDEIDIELALEAARETSPELFRRLGGVCLEECGGFYSEDSLTDEERGRKIEEVLNEMNARVNELYRRKKLEKEGPV